MKNLCHLYTLSPGLVELELSHSFLETIIQFILSLLPLSLWSLACWWWQIIGWREPPVRHLLVLLTDAAIHFAGDGKVCTHHDFIGSMFMTCLHAVHVCVCSCAVWLCGGIWLYCICVRTYVYGAHALLVPLMYSSVFRLLTLALMYVPYNLFHSDLHTVPYSLEPLWSVMLAGAWWITMKCTIPLTVC